MSEYFREPIPHHCPVCRKHFCYETAMCRAWWAAFWQRREADRAND